MASMDTIADRHHRLIALLQACDSMVVAFSGGVDSSLLLAVARQVLGDGVVAMTARSAVHPIAETENAVRIARDLGVRHVIVESGVMDDPDFLKNGPQRCYFCKKRMFSAMIKTAAELGIRHLMHGANADDRHDFRPGFKAADEMGVLAPLVEAGFGKADIRLLARQLGLPNWDRPAMACLATRIPYGTPIQSHDLKQIERAEAVLKGIGIQQCRVRRHGDIARIELGPSDMHTLKADGIGMDVVRRFKALGFRFVCLDLEGYVSGKMNPEE